MDRALVPRGPLQMTIRMATLRLAPNGYWFARRMIPQDVREAYRAAFGCLKREPFPFLRRDARRATKQEEFRDWDAEDQNPCR